MTWQEAVNLVKGITYKKGWKIELLPIHDDHAFILAIKATHPDSQQWDRPEPDRILISSQQAIDLHRLHSMSAEDFCMIIRSIVLRMEAHEADEWLRFDGKQLNNPHKDDRWEF